MANVGIPPEYAFGVILLYNNFNLPLMNELFFKMNDETL